MILRVQRKRYDLVARHIHRRRRVPPFKFLRPPLADSKRIELREVGAEWFGGLLRD
jgi:hypothetical protein